MQLVNKQNDFLVFLSNRQNFLQPLLELPAIFRPGNHRRQVQLKKPLAFQKLRHLIIGNLLRQALNYCSFTNTRLAD